MASTASPGAGRLSRHWTTSRSPCLPAAKMARRRYTDSGSPSRTSRRARRCLTRVSSSRPREEVRLAARAPTLVSTARAPSWPSPSRRGAGPSAPRASSPPRTARSARRIRCTSRGGSRPATRSFSTIWVTPTSAPLSRRVPSHVYWMGMGARASNPRLQSTAAALVQCGPRPRRYHTGLKVLC